MCDLDITIIIKDRDLDKIVQYCSGAPEDGKFTPEKALEDIAKHQKLDKSLKTVYWPWLLNAQD